MLVTYLITRPSAALFLNHKIVLFLCSCVVLVSVCYACEVFDNAAFGHVILNHIFALSLCSCVVLVEMFLEGDVRTSARGRTLLREIEWRSKGNPFGN